MRCEEGKDEISWDETVLLLAVEAVNDEVVISPTQINKLMDADNDSNNTNKLLQYLQQKATSPLPPTE